MPPGFSVPLYFASHLVPKGIWQKLPRLHYRIFHAGKPLNRAEIKHFGSLANFDRAKHSAILVALGDSPEALALAGMFGPLAGYLNAVLITDREGAVVGKSGDTGSKVVKVSDPRDAPYVLAGEVEELCCLGHGPAPLIANIGALPFLKPLWAEFIYQIYIVGRLRQDEAAKDLLIDCACAADQIGLLGDECRQRAMAMCPHIKRLAEAAVIAVPDQGHVLQPPNDASGSKQSDLAAFILGAVDVAVRQKRQEVADQATIRRGKVFKAAFAYPKQAKNAALALNYYTAAWRRNIHQRKPFAGFHPGIYADHHPGIQRDPLAHFLDDGKPSGPWASTVIRPRARRFPGKEFLGRCALHIHLHYPDTADAIFGRLATLRDKPDIFITATSEEGSRQIEHALGKYNLACSALDVVPNRGRNIGPLFTGMKSLFGGDYEVLGHLHGKKSAYNARADFGVIWARFLYDNLIGRAGLMMMNVLSAMERDKTIGLVFPDDPSVVGWDENFRFAVPLAEKLGLPALHEERYFNFPAGTMFWARTEALRPLADLNLQWEDYPEEPLPAQDGTMLHAIERLVPFVAEHRGYRCAVTNVPGLSR